MEGASESALDQNPQSESINADVVDECPPPPNYSKVFASLNLQPPVLDEGKEDLTWSLENQYNGVVGVLALRHQIITAKIPDTVDFRSEMQR